MYTRNHVGTVGPLFRGHQWDPLTGHQWDPLRGHQWDPSLEQLAYKILAPNQHTHAYCVKAHGCLYMYM